MGVWFWIGLGTVAALLLIPAVMLGRILWGIASAFAEHRRSVAGRRACELPGLGRFEADDDRHWVGQAAGLSLVIVTGGGPPGHAEEAAVRGCLNGLDGSVRIARAWLAEHRRAEAPEIDAGRLEPIGLMCRGDGDFTIDLAETKDEHSDWVISLRFRGGTPVEAALTH